MTEKAGVESPGFIAYMEDKFPRPREFRHNDMCDTSPEAIERRKRTFYGHVGGLHPALLWHLNEYRKTGEQTPP